MTIKKRLLSGLISTEWISIVAALSDSGYEW